MLRNRELLLFMAGAAAVTAAAALVCAFSRLPPAAVCIAGCAGICALSAVYTLRRYRAVARLGAYLAGLSRGEAALDILDNTEGELSILKNEIYKVTVALVEQSDRLAHDKREMAVTFADISHQLKTPLTALGVMAELLDHDHLPAEKRRDFLANIRAGLDRMQWLVLALLKLVRLDADAAALKRERVALSALVERALAPLVIPAEVREQEVTVSGRDTGVICDPEWTAEALGNILKNAVENTPAGGRITVSFGWNPLYAFITVRDSGPGIDRADLPHLFRRFYRGKNAGRDSAGIGLAMSLAVMRKQSGDIDVSSDNGSVFTLKFYQPNGAPVSE